MSRETDWHVFDKAVELTASTLRGTGGAQVTPDYVADLFRSVHQALDEAVQHLGGPDVALAVAGKGDDQDHQADAIAKTLDTFGRNLYVDTFNSAKVLFNWPMHKLPQQELIGASDFPSEYVPYISAGIVNTGTHTISEWSMLSLMGRVNYSFDGKYLFTATVRRDGSSRFGQNNRWGTFPSFSVGYNVSEEPFMESVDFISNLKFRASYGIAGNNAIGNYTHIGLLGSSTYVEGSQRIPGVVPSSLSNYDLTWERSKQSNVGVDLSLFDDRISLTADVYRDLKTDLLLAVTSQDEITIGPAERLTTRVGRVPVLIGVLHIRCSSSCDLLAGGDVSHLHRVVVQHLLQPPAPTEEPALHGSHRHLHELGDLRVQRRQLGGDRSGKQDQRDQRDVLLAYHHDRSDRWRW